MSSKLLIIGIDSLDARLLSKFGDSLPNFKKLKQNGVMLESESVYPPDSDTAWATIYTGWNPARHGIVSFKDPLEKAGTKLDQDTDNSTVRGNTFWDIAGRSEKKVCLIFPHLGYPVWDVNGVMFGRTSKVNKKKYPILSHPALLSQNNSSLQQLNVVTGLPSNRSYDKFINSWKKLIESETEFGLKQMSSQVWDLFLIYSSGADWIQHNIWRYYDESDPSYPGQTKYKHIIEQCYQWYDQMIGRFIETVDKKTTIMVISDHGHGRRPTKLVNINEVLRSQGYLVPRIKKSSPSDPYYLIEIFRRKTVAIINRYSGLGLGTLASKLLKIVPIWRQIYVSPPTIDWKKTTAYVSDLSGIKAYDYGGIIINKNHLKEADYEPLRTDLINEISGLREPETGHSLFKWIKRREELYSGEYIYKYPDIVFELAEDYGAGWAIHDNLISPCHTHNIVPGSHKIHSAVFIISNLNGKRAYKTKVFLTDIAPTVLEILGIKSGTEFDGESIFAE